MQALETIAIIKDHRHVIQNDALPAHVNQAHVIVLWEPTRSEGRRLPPPALAGEGEEKGDLINSAPATDWETLS